MIPYVPVKKTSIYLSDDLDARLAERAAEEGITKADLIRRVLTAAVERPRRPKPAVGIVDSRTPPQARPR